MIISFGIKPQNLNKYHPFDTIILFLKQMLWITFLQNLCERYEATFINFPEKKYSQYIESTLCTTARSLLHKYLSKPHACNFSVGETVPRDNTGRCWWHVSCHGKILAGITLIHWPLGYLDTIFENTILIIHFLTGIFRLSYDNALRLMPLDFTGHT